MNELQTLERLLDELLKGVQDILISGEILSDEFQGLLAQELQSTVARIDFLRAESNEPPPIGTIEEEEKVVADQVAPSTPEVPPTPPTGQVPELDPAPHESSNINAFKYDPETEQLYVKFQGKYPSQNGPVYSYEGVPAYIFNIFARGAVGPKTSGKNDWHEWKKGVTPSHGAAMNALIKAGAFPYQKVS